MGKLRLESKVNVVDIARYRHRKDLLLSKATEPVSDRVRYDLNHDEDVEEVHNQFEGIARREKVDVRIRRLARDNSLELVFQTPKEPVKKITIDRFRLLVIDALKRSGRAMKRREILSATGLPVASWSRCIKSMLLEGSITRSGQKNNAYYSLA